jgi:hypothetical protein
MASIAREPNGRRRIQFVAADGSRKTIRLGKVSQRAAEAVKVHVERLVTVSITGAPIEDETARWVANLDAELSEKLARVGLIRATSHATLGAFLEGELAKATVKGATTIFYGHTIRNLEQFFGADKPLRTITPGDADDFRRFLVSEGLAPVTVARRVSLAKTFFRAAVRHKLVATNPFDGVTGGAEIESQPLAFYHSRSHSENSRCLPGRRVATFGGFGPVWWTSHAEREPFPSLVGHRLGEVPHGDSLVQDRTPPGRG